MTAEDWRAILVWFALILVFTELANVTHTITY